MDDSPYTNMRPRKYKIPKADSTDAAGGDSVAPGDIVKVHGLVNAAQHNGRTGVVLKKMESEGGCRFQVYTPRLTNCLSIKPANLDKVQLDLDEKSHQHVAFWPRGSSARVPVSQLEGFPTEWQREKHFLVQSLGWRSPEILGGVEHPGRPKPCWMFYYDADETEAPINEAAMSMAGKVPDYELAKVPAPRDGNYRGLCVLVYSPMMSSVGFGSAEDDHPMPTNFMPTSAQDEKWSLRDMRELVEWHDAAAGSQYRRHNDPMHRVSGPMPGGGYHAPGPAGAPGGAG